MTPLSRRSFIFMSLALAACKRGAADFILSGNTMGTSYSVVIVDPNGTLDPDTLHAGIKAGLEEVDRQMSNWNPASEISKINALKIGGMTDLSASMEYVLKAAQDVNHVTNGQFDVTLGPAIDLWGFGATGQHNIVPSEVKSKQTLAMVGQNSAISLTPGRIQKTAENASIYLSGIGKGFGVDQLANVLNEFGIKDFMVEIGGDIYTQGVNREGRSWQIAIETPDAGRRDVHKVVGVSGLGLATSGDYRNYFVHDGQRFSHILDPKTGRPVTHATASVTVLAENAMLADAWATGLLALGRKQGLEVAEEFGLSAYFIERTVQSSKEPFLATASARFSEIIA